MNYFSEEIIVPRLMKHTELKDGHKLWIGSITKQGYGMITLYGKTYLVNRIAAFLFLGLDITDREWQANHKDDICQHKNCWEPNHLYIGTKQDNAIDAMTAGKLVNQNTGKTHCKRGHEFTPENTYIKQKGKECKQCSHERSQRHRDILATVNEQRRNK